jgi:hypothetical protein
MNSMLKASEMSREQYAWGLSNGVAVLTISGVFWLSLAAWTTGFVILLITLPLALLVGGVLIRAKVRLRRRFPGFSPRSLREAPKGSLTKRIIVSFYVVTAAQWISIVLVGGIGSALHRSDLIWPLIGLVISLHFLPLGRLFGVRAYYLLGIVGTVITVFSILALTDGLRLITVGFGLGVLMIGGAAYLIANAESLVSAGAVRSQ